MSKRLAIILAAGKGTRMKSDLPKVLCPVRGRPMVEFVLDALRKAGVDHLLVVVGYRSDLVRQTLEGHTDVEFVDQTEQLGTGHAVKMCRPQLARHNGPVLIVTGDSPLTQVESVAALFRDFDADRPACVLGTLHKEKPAGLGRIVRDSRGEFAGIVEEKDATPEQRAVTEVNMSTYVFDAPKLVRALDVLQNTNQQKEYYLTDCPGILRSWGEVVRALPVLKPCEALSINTFSDLAVVEAAMQEMGLYMQNRELKIFSGQANQPLAKAICGFLNLPLGAISLGKFPVLLWIGWSHFGLAANDNALYTFSFLTLLYFAAFSIVSARERRGFWKTMPSKTLVAALTADVLTGTVLTFVGLPGLMPLPWWQTLAIFGYAMVSCLVVNDTVKVAMIKWRVGE